MVNSFFMLTNHAMAKKKNYINKCSLKLLPRTNELVRCVWLLNHKWKIIAAAFSVFVVHTLRDKSADKVVHFPRKINKSWM